MNLHEKYWTRDLLRATKAFIRWEELIPRKKKSKVRGKSKKIKKLVNVLSYWSFRLQRWLTITRVQMIISTRFHEKKYKSFIEKWKNTKAEVTISIF